MKFYQTQHKYYCGIDLHSKTMYLCVVDQAGNKCLHQNMRNDAAYFLKLISKFREDIIVGAECVYCWYWLADVCAEHEVPFILGHAQYMKAVHGGKVKNDKVDSEKIALLLRSGMFPKAYVYPREMRSTRDLLRRRTTFVRQRAALLGHIQRTGQQFNLPAFGRLRSKNVQAEIASRFPDADTRQAINADVELIARFNDLIPKLELHVLKRGQVHGQRSLSVLQTIKGIGEVLSLTMLYEIHTIDRFPEVQDFISYSRLVKCPRESAGSLYGFSGSKIGNPYLKWAFSEAVMNLVQFNPRIKSLADKLELAHGFGKSRAMLRRKLGRSIYFMLKNGTAFDEDKFLS